MDSQDRLNAQQLRMRLEAAMKYLKLDSSVRLVEDGDVRRFTMNYGDMREAEEAKNSIDLWQSMSKKEPMFIFEISSDDPRVIVVTENVEQ